MTLLDAVPTSHASIGYPAASKPELIQDLAIRLCGVADVDSRDCVRSLLERETLGSTGMGGGTAIPHVRLAALYAPAGFVVRLKKAIDFDAIDAVPVSLVCLLLLPASDAAACSAVLARVARRFRDPVSVKAMRNAVSNQAFHAAFIREPGA